MFLNLHPEQNPGDDPELLGICVVCNQKQPINSFRIVSPEYGFRYWSCRKHTPKMVINAHQKRISEILKSPPPGDKNG